MKNEVFKIYNEYFKAYHILWWYDLKQAENIQLKEREKCCGLLLGVSEEAIIEFYIGLFMSQSSHTMSYISRGGKSILK